jgi:hypothetical protein
VYATTGDSYKDEYHSETYPVYGKNSSTYSFYHCVLPFEVNQEKYCEKAVTVARKWGFKTSTSCLYECTHEVNMYSSSE